MLIGDKVTLGPVLNGDGAMLFNWFNHLGLAATNGSFRPVDETKFSQWIAGLGNDVARVTFAIRANQLLRLLGYVQITNINAVVRSAEIGVAIGEAKDRGQGFGQEALTLALRYCWSELNLRRVTLFVLSNNPAALHVYRKVGFETEGLLRQAAYTNGQFHDVTVMAMLRPQENPPTAPVQLLKS